VRAAEGPDRRPGRARRFWSTLDGRAGVPVAGAAVTG
jgi:hypothetical protein